MIAALILYHNSVMINSTFQTTLGLIPSAIAKGKGKSFGIWWFYVACLFIIALPHALIMKFDTASIELYKMNEGMKKCPYCAELVKAEAKIYRYCNREFEQQAT